MKGKLDKLPIANNLLDANEKLGDKFTVISRANIRQRPLP